MGLNGIVFDPSLINTSIKLVWNMEFKEILFYSSVLVFTVGYISFKYYEKKYESFTKDQSDEKK